MGLLSLERAMHSSFVGPIFTIVRTGAQTVQHVVTDPNEDVDDCDDAALLSVAQPPPITIRSRTLTARDLVGIRVQN